MPQCAVSQAVWQAWAAQPGHVSFFRPRESIAGFVTDQKRKAAGQQLKKYAMNAA